MMNTHTHIPEQWAVSRLEVNWDSLGLGALLKGTLAVDVQGSGKLLFSFINSTHIYPTGPGV